MADTPALTKERRLSREFSAYLLASVVALAVDTTLLLLLARWMHYLVAASVAFLAGMFVCYGLTVRYVFSVRRYCHNVARETLIFFLVGVLGLAVNDLIILVAVTRLAAPLIAAKALAAAGSFIFNFGGRKLLLFRGT